MDTLTFVVQLTSSLAWPIVSVTLGFVFRKQLQHFLTTVKKVKGLGVEFEREVASLEPSVAQLSIPQTAAPGKSIPSQPGRAERSTTQNDISTKSAASGTLTISPDRSRELLEHATAVAELSPNAAVVLAWTNIEQELRSLNAHIFPENSQLLKRIGIAQIYALREADVINEAVVSVLIRMRELRNKAAHSGAGDVQLPISEAKTYAEMAVNIVAYLESLKFTHGPLVA